MAWAEPLRSFSHFGSFAVWRGPMHRTANQPFQRQLGQLCCPLAREAARSGRTGEPAGGALIVQARANWGDRPQGTPRLVLQRNPPSDPEDKGRRSADRRRAMERRRSAPQRYRAHLRPAFAWGEGGAGASRESKPRLQALTSRKAWANDIGSEVYQRAARGMPLTSCPKRAACSIPSANSTPAASASSPTSRASPRTRSSRTRSTSSRTSSIAARWERTRSPATAPAS